MTQKINNILLIDDDATTNFLHKHALEKAKVAHHVQVAETVQEALAFWEAPGSAEKEKPELIFLDLNLPGLTGWDFIEEYKKVKVSNSSFPIIIILSASANYNDRLKAQQMAEIAEFRNKPLTSESIQEIVLKYFPS